MEQRTVLRNFQFLKIMRYMPGIGDMMAMEIKSVFLLLLNHSNHLIGCFNVVVFPGINQTSLYCYRFGDQRKVHTSSSLHLPLVPMTCFLL